MTSYRTVRSVKAPDPQTADVFGMTEKVLQTESERLEKLLADRELSGEQIERLEKVRKCMQRFAALKRDKTASSE